jgi:putative DNA primase/helicase
VSQAQPSLIDTALAFAARGWPVFPCSPANKRPLLPREKDADGKPIKGSGGVSKASCDADQVRAWWKKWPRAMIGFSVGRAKLFVVDFDPRIDAETGEEFTLDRLKAETEAQIGCALPVTLAVRTPSGGVHVYFRQPEGDPITNRGNLPDHVDVRGLGGYTILPPSYCQGDGKNAQGGYRWLRDDADAAIVAAPAQLIEALRAKPGAPGAEDQRAAAGPAHLPPSDVVDERVRRFALKALDEECRELAATPIGGGRHGGRNQGIYWSAYNLGQLVGAGALQEGVVRASIEAVVRAMPHNNDLPGALQTIENGLENGKAKPRDLSNVGTRFPPRSRTDPRPPSPDDASYGNPGPGPDDGGEYFDPSISEACSPGGSARGCGGRIRVEPDDELDRRCAFFPTTDLGNAERFRARHGHRFRFCKELGWFTWDGRRWALLSEEKDKTPGEVSLAVFRDRARHPQRGRLRRRDGRARSGP